MLELYPELAAEIEEEIEKMKIEQEELEKDIAQLSQDLDQRQSTTTTSSGAEMGTEAGVETVQSPPVDVVEENENDDKNEKLDLSLPILAAEILKELIRRAQTDLRRILRLVTATVQPMVDTTRAFIQQIKAIVATSGAREQQQEQPEDG